MSTLRSDLIQVYACFLQSFRYKLLVLVLLPLVVFIPLITVFALHRSYAFAQDQLYHKVRTDINIASTAFSHQQQKYLQALTQLAESHAFYSAMRKHDKTRIQNLLLALKVTEDLDFVHIVDLHGKWLYDDAVFSGETKPSPLIQQVVHSGLPLVGLERYSPAYLQREQQNLISKTGVTRSSANNKATDTNSLGALVMRAVCPIKNLHGQTVALLEGGILLNDNMALVGAITQMVYGSQSLSMDNNSLISVILNDTRVASNLFNNIKPLQSNQGTRIPAIVRHDVLQSGKQWVGEVDTTAGNYISAYQPIRDYQGQIIGMLEAGYLAAPLRQAYRHDLLLLGLLLFLSVIAAAALTILAARRIFKPIERIADVIRAQERGEDQRIGTIHSRDEIGAVARHFDNMLDLLHEHNAEIQRAADNLELQVQARTRELQIKNVDLENTIMLLNKTRQQLVWAEKFMALGELTAGIAHEINNPTAVILGNMDVLTEELGDSVRPYKTEVALIYEQVSRIHAIVENLLKYSRATPASMDLHMVDVNKLIMDSMLLVQHETTRKHTEVLTQLGSNCKVRINAQELQQVLINLILNAIHAVSTHGCITIRSYNTDDSNVCIQVSDNGHGITQQSIDRIFDPFYTTKGSDGTGLGLSISYGLIHRYGGNLEVDSTVGKGTTFSVHLQREPQLSARQQLLFDLYSHNKSMRG